ncbi:uncharacterized protein PV09_08313 [Verruconis gallopava]|uniref:Glucose-methanol-choline oxidoreductase N-terminal domain-containing protein n=1 Tax=Verruconis gallopava TaxID=253628 RepID=A0A0D2A1D8_9PEZI|nr:uncharacterized protein PV09_08313 [Verruconis gallopava]KIW00135.1 hypothetical protein PV09_08313 [Verruconis gallopava]
MGNSLRSLILSAGMAAGAALQARNSSTSWQFENWDVIVVGAGPAGIIVADRMSEAGKKTLLLEGGGSSYAITGGTESPAWLDGSSLSRVDVPGLYKSIFSVQGDLTCQNYTTAFVGCTIGGSSAINAGLFFQPPASDFDDYFPAGWKFSDVNASISKVYATIPASDVYSQDKTFYLQTGYTAARKWLVDGAGFADVDLNKEANNKSKVFGRPIFDYIDGQRGGPVRTYLQTSLKRDNFHLQMNTRVLRVARNGTTATGVVLAADNSTVKLAPGGRVILSAGAMQSPQILMYSGIGDPSLRQNLTAGGILDGVNGWIDNAAVGDGLFDNPNTFIELEGPSIESYTYSYTDPISEDARAYLDTRSGPYSFASETSAFWDYIENADGSKTACQGTIDSAGYGSYTNNNTITLNVYGTSGLKSKGKVILNEKYLPSNSPEVYYSDPQDAEAIAQFIFNIFQSLPGSGLTPLNIQANWTKDEIKDYITSSTEYTRGAVQHWSSSCRIGSCVDVNAQVVGTTNIHVVDASILEPLTVNPQFGTMIAAEHASELILKLK